MGINDTSILRKVTAHSDKRKTPALPGVFLLSEWSRFGNYTALVSFFIVFLK